jgi:hypothetical protein
MTTFCRWLFGLAGLAAVVGLGLAGVACVVKAAGNPAIEKGSRMRQ